MAGWPVILTGWPVMVGVVKVGVVITRYGAGKAGKDSSGWMMSQIGLRQSCQEW